jgi:hypothetical protein
MATGSSTSTILWGIRSSECTFVHQIEIRLRHSSTVSFFSLSARSMACCNQLLLPAKGSGSARTHRLPDLPLIHLACGHIINQGFFCACSDMALRMIMLLIAAGAVGILLLALPVAGSNDILCEFPLCAHRACCVMTHSTPFPVLLSYCPCSPAIFLIVAFLSCSFARWPRWEKFFGQHGAVRREANKVGEMIIGNALLDWTRRYSTNATLFS